MSTNYGPQGPQDPPWQGTPAQMPPWMQQQQPPDEVRQPQQPPPWIQQGTQSQQGRWQQPSTNQPPWMQQPLPYQPPTNQPGQMQYSGQSAQNYPFQPQPMSSSPANVSLAKQGFFHKRVGCIPLWVLILLMVLVLIPAIANANKSDNASTNDSATPSSNSNTVGSSAASITPTSKPTSIPTPKPTPIPTKTPAQIAAAYKASTIPMTVTSLDKNGSAYTGKEVHFTCEILKFVKDSTGVTAGANVTTQDTTSVIQVLFTTGTDISRLNEGDILEVWGTDQGVFSGTNAFGGEVQEVAIAAKYMNDQTTNYQAVIQNNKKQNF